MQLNKKIIWGGQTLKSLILLACFENYHSNGTKQDVMAQKSPHHSFCPGVFGDIYLLTPDNLRSTFVSSLPRDAMLDAQTKSTFSLVKVPYVYNTQDRIS